MLILFKKCQHLFKFESQSQNSPPMVSIRSQANLIPIQTVHSILVLQLTYNPIYSEVLQVRSSLKYFRILVYLEAVLFPAASTINKLTNPQYNAPN
jgi:hypothetical protein